MLFLHESSFLTTHRAKKESIMNKYLLAADIENLKRLYGICKQEAPNEKTQMLLQSLEDLIPIEQPAEAPENERDLSDRDTNILLQEKISTLLSNLLFFLEPFANSHFALAQEIMLYRFEDLRADYPKDKCHWYQIVWILLWNLHQLQIRTSPNLRNMERIP